MKHMIQIIKNVKKYVKKMNILMKTHLHVKYVMKDKFIIQNQNNVKNQKIHKNQKQTIRRRTRRITSRRIR